MRGVIAIGATPFTDENTIDVPSLRRSTRLSLEKGVVAFAVPAMAGEVTQLNDEERELLVKTVLETVEGKVPVKEQDRD